MAMDVRIHPLEYARADLPQVCAVTGEPAALYVRVGARKPPSPASLLLLFLGPVGWLILLAILARPDATYIEIPVSRRVFDDINERRHRTRWLLVGVVLVVAAGASSVVTALGAWLLLVPLLALTAWVGAVPNRRIKLSIDGVGLVTVRSAHPGFADAVSAWRSNANAGIG